MLTKNRLAACEKLVYVDEKPDVYLDENRIVRFIPKYKDSVDKLNLYDPDDVPSLQSFLTDDATGVKIIIGPYGSGKTSGICNAIIRDAIEMPKCDDGIRRYKIALVRNTAGELESTTLTTWLFWAKNLPAPYRTKKPILSYNYRFRDDKGIIELSTMFLALDREADVNKLGSLELTSAYFNELQYIPQAIFVHMQARIGRYPSKSLFSDLFDAKRLDNSELIFEEFNPYAKRIYADTNAPSSKHWIPRELENKDVSNIKVYHQPPALIKNEAGEWTINDEADNLRFQGYNYYLGMINSSEEFIRVYAQGYYGIYIDGQKVYTNYNDDLHSVEQIPIVDYEPIILGVDYGTVSPACVLAQYVKGQLRYIKEFVCEYMTIKELFKIEVIPFLNSKLDGYMIEVVDDPANTYHGREQLQELGFDPRRAPTNDPEKRISTTRNLLNELVCGKPRLLVSRSGCPVLREAFLGKYHYRRMRVISEEAKYADVPEKNHPHSDIADSAQYVALRVTENELLKMEESAEEVRQRVVNEFNETTRSQVTGY